MWDNKVLIPYFTYGDPTPLFSEDLVCEAFDAGADIVELGVPFSDPIADGPVIQSSHYRALKNDKVGISGVLSAVERIKKRVDKPIIIMASVNLILQFGVEAFFQEASKVGLDGAVIPDLPVEVASDYIRFSDQYGVDLVFLVSTLCQPERLRKLVEGSRGFVYLISSLGTTGERAVLSASLSRIVDQIRSVKRIPVAVGFGISTPEHVASVTSYAQGAIIGSHFVRCFEDSSRSVLGNKRRVLERIKILKNAI